jgi:L-fucose isomerase-like protein
MISTQPMTFALFFGNRGFFSERLISAARSEMVQAVERSGHRALLMDAGATPHGAVESASQGQHYARWLAEQKNVDGVILCLPNFGDETGAVAALKDARLPILIHAYPDELTKMGFSSRRDAFCGKFSVMDVFCQYRVPFTSFQPHVVHPDSSQFDRHLADFAGVCRVTAGMKNLTVGAIGARTSAFKTVRFDETTLQKHGITTETLDLSSVIHRVRKLGDSDSRLRDKAERLKGYSDCSGVPNESFGTMVKLAVVLDEVIAEMELDALAIRCWLELEQELKVAPCLLVSEINDRGIPCACEVDVCNAVAMMALRLAAQKPATCLDWNNNYGDHPDKCILFHCGPVPQSLMAARGKVIDHPMFAKALGAGCGWGPNVGRIAPSEMTYASSKTDNGLLTFYLGQGRMTDDPIADDFFGCAGVAQIENLQEKLQKIGYAGYRHHVSMTFGHVETAVREAFVRYLGYSIEPL